MFHPFKWNVVLNSDAHLGALIRRLFNSIFNSIWLVDNQLFISCTDMEGKNTPGVSGPQPSISFRRRKVVLEFQHQTPTTWSNRSPQVALAPDHDETRKLASSSWTTFRPVTTVNSNQLSRILVCSCVNKFSTTKRPTALFFLQNLK